jgi:hypothetical protein
VGGPAVCCVVGLDVGGNCPTDTCLTGTCRFTGSECQAVGCKTTGANPC